MQHVFCNIRNKRFHWPKPHNFKSNTTRYYTHGTDILDDHKNSAIVVSYIYSMPNRIVLVYRPQTKLRQDNVFYSCLSVHEGICLPTMLRGRQTPTIGGTIGGRQLPPLQILSTGGRYPSYRHASLLSHCILSPLNAPHVPEYLLPKLVMTLSKITVSASIEGSFLLESRIESDRAVFMTGMKTKLADGAQSGMESHYRLGTVNSNTVIRNSTLFKVSVTFL